MKTKDIVLIVLATLLLGFVAYLGYGVYSLKDIKQSYMEGNIPSNENFDKYLKRDLSKYFSDRLGKPTSVEYELLRNTPTQSGTADPKYYAWVKVIVDNREEQGAIQVAAIDKEYFLVTDYFSSDQIKNNPMAVDNIVPNDVAAKIKDKIE